MRNSNLVAFLIVTVLFSLGAGVGGGYYVANNAIKSYETEVKAKEQTATKVKELAKDETAQIAAIEKVQPTVVSIIATKDLQVIRRSPFGISPFEQFFFGNPSFNNVPESEVETVERQVSGGTGFIIQADGLVVTNKHVVADTEADYTVVMNDGKEYPAAVVSRDPANDLAFVQIFTDEERKSKAKELPFAQLGSSKDLVVGQSVIAIGNALGEFQNSVTSGIISAKERQIQASDQRGGNAETLSNLIQTDAAINQGNSGGPLINLQGEVIGVNTAVANGAQGIGFAIAVDDLKPVLSSLEKYGEIKRPQLGVRYMILTPELAKERDLKIEQGALVVGNDAEGFFAVLPGSPAEKAGLKAADVIQKVNGKELTSKYTLSDIIRQSFPGDKLEMEVWRSGKTIKITAALEEL